MPSITLEIPFKKNGKLALTPEELRSIYLFGIDIKDSSGREYTNENLQFYIEAAQKEMENYLVIKLTRQIIEEELDFYFDDWSNWGFIKTTYPVREVFALDGFIGTTRQVQYPKEWLSAKKPGDGLAYHRSINLVPNNSVAQTSQIVFSGITPHLGFFGNRTIPQYWTVRYCTGYDPVPSDILDAMGKLAAIKVFHNAGDLIIGAGIAKSILSIDGLHETIETTQSAENSGYSGRIKGYLTDLKTILPQLKDFYKGIIFESL